MTTETPIAHYAAIVRKLLQSVIYDDDKYWSELSKSDIEIPLRKYLEQIGLELIFDKQEGFAFLKEIDFEDAEINLPRLNRRIALSYPVTLICFLLRDWIDEHDNANFDSKRLFVTHQELKDGVDVFYKNLSNKVKHFSKIDSNIKSVVELGFLKINQEGNSIDETQYEVKRIIKARIDSEKLKEIKTKLEIFNQE